MGLIKAFFRPLTDAVKIYKYMTQETAEEINHKKLLKEAGEKIKTRQKTFADEVTAKHQEVLKDFNSKVIAFKSATDEVNDVNAKLLQLSEDMQNPDIPKEEIFHRMQLLGVDFSPENGLKVEAYERSVSKLESIHSEPLQFDTSSIDHQLNDLKNSISETTRKASEAQQNLGIGRHASTAQETIKQNMNKDKL